MSAVTQTLTARDPANQTWRALLRENVYGHKKKVGLLRDVLERLRPAAPGPLRVLDVGCGNGSAVTQFLAVDHAQVLGIDRHQPSIAYARQHFGSDAVQFREQLAEDLLQENARFDAIVFADVLEHVDSPRLLLDCARRLLNPGGRVLVTIPNGHGPFELESALSRTWLGNKLLRIVDLGVAVLNKFIFRGAWTRVVEATADVPYNHESGHVQFFTRRAFRRVAREAGFDVVEARNLSWFCGPYTNFVFAPSQLFCRWNTAIADHLPAFLASAWFFELRPIEEKLP